MNTSSRPLSNISLNLSISESNDSEDLGFPEWQVNRITLQIVSALFGQGTRIVFGHDWREDGLMEAVHGFALYVNGSPSLLESQKVQKEEITPLLNILPWPDEPRLSETDQTLLRATLRIIKCGVPDELQGTAGTQVNVSKDPNLFKYLRSRGLTHLRHQLNSNCDARLCLGGRISGSSGRYPGVIEEALLAVLDSKPLYLSASLGGASEQVIKALNGIAMPETFCPTSEINEVYQRYDSSEDNSKTKSDRIIDRTQVWKRFTDIGVDGIAKINGLSVEENQELFATTSIDTIIRLVLQGLSHVKKRNQIKFLR